MGLFNKNKREEIRTEEMMPQLPSLPRLPELPRLESEQIHQLPSFPSNNFGSKFSQNMIKDAVSGEKEGADFSTEMVEEEELADAYDSRMMRQPLKPVPEDTGVRRVSGFSGMGNEPLFIRIDKFEGALAVLKDAKKRVSELESAIEEVKVVKEKEDKELQAWENEVKAMKDQIDKIDRDLFSKV